MSNALNFWSETPSRAGSDVVTRVAEGAPRPGPWYLPISGGWLPSDVGDTWNWWQRGFDIQYYSPSALVEACVGAYAQTVAMCPGDHWIRNDDGGRDRQTTTALYRILRKPNAYQSQSDFLLNATRNLYIDGNAYALALRNDRYEVSELHLMNSRQSMPIIAETGDIFYALSGNDVIARALDYPLLVPARDVLHIRLHTGRQTLIGESPLMAVARDIATNDAVQAQQIQFYLNQARPSTVLTTDMVLDAATVAALRDRWNEQSRGLNAGGTPILTAGLKPVPLSTTAKDAELADMMKMSEQHIALAFRVPLQILGIGGAPLGSTEALMQSWVASGLGFCLNHIEEAYGRLFGLIGFPDEYVELDTSALLRSAQKELIDSLARGVQGGIFSPNEARANVNLPKVKFGDEPRVQQQVVPLSAAGAIPAAPSPAAAPPARPVPLASSGEAKDHLNEHTVQRAARSLLKSASGFDRRRVS